MRSTKVVQRCARCSREYETQIGEAGTYVCRYCGSSIVTIIVTAEELAKANGLYSFGEDSGPMEWVCDNCGSNIGRLNHVQDWTKRVVRKSKSDPSRIAK